MVTVRVLPEPVTFSAGETVRPVSLSGLLSRAQPSQLKAASVPAASFSVNRTLMSRPLAPRVLDCRAGRAWSSVTLKGVVTLAMPWALQQAQRAVVRGLRGADRHVHQAVALLVQVAGAEHRAAAVEDLDLVAGAGTAEQDPQVVAGEAGEVAALVEDRLLLCRRCG